MSFFDRLSLTQRSLIPALIGLLFYGVWAFLVNIMHGPVVAFKAACVQGSYSFFITLCMTLMLEVLYKFFMKISGRQIVSAVCTIIFTCAPVFIGSWMINVVAGTPEIFNTVVLGYLIGAAYSASYVIGLLKKSSS